MLQNKKTFSNIVLFFFLTIFFLLSFIKFHNLPPRIDQSFHMYWLDKIVSSNLDFSTNYNEILSHFSLKNSFIYELFRVMISQQNFFSYYFQALFILLLGILYSLSHFLFQDLVTFYNFYSILFSTLNILLCYKILEIILLSLDINKRIIFNKIIFILIFSSYYLFFFSPLGVHNFAAFFFLLTIFFFLKKINEMNNLIIFLIGILSTISIFFHMSNLIFLLPIIFCFTLTLRKKIKEKLLLVFFYLIPISFAIIPFLVLLILFHLEADYSFLNETKKIGFLKNIFFYFKNFLILLGPTIIFASFNFFIKKNRKNKQVLFIATIIIFHFFLYLLLSPLSDTFLRNFLYISYLYLILFSVFLISILEKFKSKSLIFIVVVNFILNVSLINNEKLLSKYNNFYFNYYFKDNNLIFSFNNEIKNIFSTIEKNNLIIIDNQNTLNYVISYNKEIIKSNQLFTNPSYIHKTFSDNKALDIVKKKLKYIKIKNNNPYKIFISIVPINLLEVHNKNFDVISNYEIENFTCSKTDLSKFKKKVYFLDRYYFFLINQFKCELK